MRIFEMKSLWILFGLLLASAGVTATDCPPSLYEEWRKTPSPRDGAVAEVNPPPLQWASVTHWENRSVGYRVEVSSDPQFSAEKTTKGKVQRACFFNLHKKLGVGTWYWRYEIQDAKIRVMKGPYSFVIATNTPVFESLDFESFVAGLSAGHPRVLTQGKTLQSVRSAAEKHPLSKEIIAKGKKTLKMAIYDGPVQGGNLAEERALSRKAGQEVGFLRSLTEAYILTGDKALYESICRRLDVVLKWPTDDLLGSQVLTTLAMVFDGLHDELPRETLSRMLKTMDKQINKGLSAWPGNIEGRQVENHFWQAELSGNFTAALATLGELDSSREMLEYTYELFLARFPNLAMSDGGWAEGLGYFGVNKSAVIDMAVLLKKVGHVDVFQKEWYRSLADYFIYFAPLNAQMDGFGDMHDRIGKGNMGQSMMFVIGQENNDAKALYRAYASSFARSKTEEKGDEGLGIEAWYQIINNIPPSMPRFEKPSQLPQARLFQGVGLAALHTDVLNSSEDTAVYFRSSPFGAKGHMHANQNCFNLSRRGEALFYSTGYYTTFGDTHSMSSYRHTRAHNGILVNGCGQAFGHEGYGWIKRYASGEHIAYVCGDATMAYQQTVDEQFLGMLKESHIEPTRENGYGDSALKLFERHVVLVRPDTVIVYDILEAEKASDWSLLLHTLKKPELQSQGELRLMTPLNSVSGVVYGSQPLVASLTDEFWSPPVDIKKKYGAMPKQYHVTYATKEKSTRMRFLTILQMADASTAPLAVREEKRGIFRVGGVTVKAQLEPSQPASLSVEADGASLYVNLFPQEAFGRTIPPSRAPATVLAEKVKGNVAITVSGNEAPRY